MRPPAILIVEQDRRVGEPLAAQLATDGYRVELARNAVHARVLAALSPPGLVVIGDMGCPRGGLALLEEVRAAASPNGAWEPTLPAIVIGAGASGPDLLSAFDAGADDFLSHPAPYLELRARVRALLRRSGESDRAPPVLEVHGLAIDTRSRTVALDGRAVALRRMEFELLAHLAGEPHRVFARPDLLRSVWGYTGGSTRTVDSHASRLRRKLDPLGSARWVVNVWGIGYRLR